MRLKASVFPVILAVALLCLLAICTVAVPLYSESPFIVDGPYRSAAAVKEERPDTWIRQSSDCASQDIGCQVFEL
jgi:hypothetical protein